MKIMAYDGQFAYTRKGTLSLILWICQAFAANKGILSLHICFASTKIYLYANEGKLSFVRSSEFKLLKTYSMYYFYVITFNNRLCNTFWTALRLNRVQENINQRFLLSPSDLHVSKPYILDKNILALKIDFVWEWSI